MQLTPPAEDHHEYTSLDLLIEQVNEHVKNEEYVLTRKRSKPSKLRILMKIVLRYDRGDKWLDESHDHRLINSKRNECPFECIAKLDDNEENPKTDLSN